MSVNLDDLKVDPQFGHRVHPIAAAFPLMGGSEMSDFVADIQDNGLREPIEYIEHNGHKVIIDGRNRLRACRQTGRRPKFVECPVKGEARLLEYVWSKNLFRRHLTASQRSQVAAGHKELCDAVYRSSAKRKASSHLKRGNGRSVDVVQTSAQTIARVAKVGQTTMKEALVVQRSGDEKLIDDVKAGTKSVSAAAKEARAKKAPTKSAKPKRSSQRKRADAASPEAIADDLIARHSPHWCIELAEAIKKKLIASGDLMIVEIDL